MHVYFGYSLILFAFGIAIICIYKKYEKLLLITSFCTIMSIFGLFVITQKRVTKLEIPGVGLIELTVSEETVFNEIINNLKTQVADDSLNLSDLKAKLDSMFTIDSSGKIIVGRDLCVGNTYWGNNPGLAVANYFTVGTNLNTHGLVLVQGNGVNLITAEVIGDGSGGVDTPRVTINNILKLTPRSEAPTYAEEGFIYYDSVERKLKVFNGTKWENIIK